MGTSTSLAPYFPSDSSHANVRFKYPSYTRGEGVRDRTRSFEEKNIDPERCCQLHEHAHFSVICRRCDERRSVHFPCLAHLVVRSTPHYPWWIPICISPFHPSTSNSKKKVMRAPGTLNIGTRPWPAVVSESLIEGM
ncbi:hypothetical protein BS17DRAFT_35213 [Gyrodon lividus]|nr:hypothetical protein BS17DRAFT_35213 [Gyrodon lividus]